MGAVYAALDTRLERQLALKVMLPQFAADAAAKERFLREARATARIKHDNVVTVYEADERQGVPYIAMEFLEGYSLDEYLKTKGSPTVPQVLRIVGEAAAGLAAAHKIGLVHRDIKPANLWLEAPNGRVKVLDFGLAKPVDAEVELTTNGAVVGTPAYMSPEQARGAKVDHRTDLFSLGVLLYRLCAGNPPFGGATTMAVLMALGTKEPRPVRDLNPTVSEPLAALIHQLLAKRADDHPASVAEVVQRLRWIAQEQAAARARSTALLTAQPPMAYAATPVTVAPEANPFADLDASDTAASSREPDKKMPATPASGGKKSGPRWPWAVGAGALFAALVAGGVIIIIKNKDGTETKIEVPDDATVTIKGKDGKVLAKVGPAVKSPPAAAISDREAAEWVIAQVGVVRANGADTDIKAAADLPKELFTLTFVNLENSKVTDAGLAHLKDLTGLIYLNLSSTALTDAGLEHLKSLRSLTTLNLYETKVTDAGLAHLKELKGLTSLVLSSKALTDAGLTRLKELKGLTYLYLGGTAVTDAGLALPKDHKGLTHLFLFQTKVTDAGLALLKDHKGLIYLSLDGAKVTDGGLEHLKDLKGLTHLGLDGTAVTDAGLEHLKNLNGLTQLRLGGTAVTDAGLAHLKDLKGLTQLEMSHTAVTDMGLQHLKSLKGLAELGVRKTAVTAKGVAALQAALPACKIEHDGLTTEPKK
jgi:eukaryotic-like serine/threonine-protein kinase